MYLYEKSIFIRAPIQLLYDFHCYPPHLSLIQPWGLSFTPSDLPHEVKKKAEMNLRLRLWGFPLDWRFQWTELSPPQGTPSQAKITQQAIKSPLHSFTYQHEMTEREGGTYLRDTAEYDLAWRRISRPFQPWIARQIHVIFCSRQRWIKRILETPLHSKATPETPEQALAWLGVHNAVSHHQKKSKPS